MKRTFLFSILFLYFQLFTSCGTYNSLHHKPQLNGYDNTIPVVKKYSNTGYVLSFFNPLAYGPSKPVKPERYIDQQFDFGKKKKKKKQSLKNLKNLKNLKKDLKKVNLK